MNNIIYNLLIENEDFCIICYNDKEKFQLFECNHEFCMDCLTTLTITSHEKGMKVTCPLCKASYTIRKIKEQRRLEEEKQATTENKHTWSDILEKNGFKMSVDANSDHPIMDRVDQIVWNTAMALVIHPVVGAVTLGLVTFAGTIVVTSYVGLGVLCLPFSIRSSIKNKKITIFTGPVFTPTTKLVITREKGIEVDFNDDFL